MRSFVVLLPLLQLGLAAGASQRLAIFSNGKVGRPPEQACQREAKIGKNKNAMETLKKNGPDRACTPTGPLGEGGNQNAGNNAKNEALF